MYQLQNVKYTAKQIHRQRKYSALLHYSVIKIGLKCAYAVVAHTKCNFLLSDYVNDSGLINSHIRQTTHSLHLYRFASPRFVFLFNDQF